MQLTRSNQFARLTFLTLFSLSAAVTPLTSQADVWEFLFGARKSASPVADRRNLIQRYKQNSRFFKDQTWKDRVVSERNPDYMDDLQYLDENVYANQTLGAIDTRFLAEFDTRFYYHAGGRPDENAMVPMVDPKAKALFIFFHGSGTAKANGGNFAYKMNKLGLMGYASIGFDMPFHGDGSKNPKLANTADYAEYVNAIVQRVKQPGQPVYLVGHSFGPDVIAEFITRYPNAVDGAALISPGGFDKTTKEWFQTKTAYMTKIFGDVVGNEKGGQWAGMVTRDNTWNKPGAKGRQDPTLVNPKLKLVVVSGDREEYVPGPLNADGLPTDEPRTYDVCKVFKSFFAHIDCIIEPGVGHYIFEHKDANGHDVILRTFLSLAGDDVANEKELRKAQAQVVSTRTTAEVVASNYSKNLFFRNWVNTRMGGFDTIREMIANQDAKRANQMQKDYGFVEKNRETALLENIKATEQWAPEFYAANSEAIGRLGMKGFEGSATIKLYQNYLKTLTPEARYDHARAPESIFDPPKKKEIPQWVLDKQAKQKENDAKGCADQMKPDETE